MTDIIGKKTIENAAEMVSAQLHEYQKEINEAYLACDDALTVSVPIKFKPENSATRIETSIKFYTGQIKDSAVRHVDEKQQDLFEQLDEARARYREILFRNFDDLRRIIEAMGPLFVYRWPNEIKYRTFSLPQPTEQPTKKPATSAKVVTMTVKHGRRKAQPGKRVAARKQASGIRQRIMTKPNDHTWKCDICGKTVTGWKDGWVRYSSALHDETCPRDVPAACSDECAARLMEKIESRSFVLSELRSRGPYCDVATKQRGYQMEPRLMSIEETAKYLGISKSWLYSRVAPSSADPFPVKSKKIGNRRLFDRKDLDEYIDELPQSA